MTIIRHISKSPLLKGGILIFISNNVVSFGNFLYNLFMGRLLTPEKFGDLGAIFSLLVLLGVPLSILHLVVVKISSSYWGAREKGKILSFMSFLTPKLFIISTMVTLFFLLINNLLGQFLKLNDYTALFIFALFFLLSAPITANKAVLHGTLSFSFITLNGVVEVFLKNAVSLLLVVLNFGLSGALLGPLLGGLAGYILTLFELRFILGNGKADTIKITSFRTFQAFMPIVLATISLTVFLTVDMILVRHFFSAAQAGEYAALSTVGKIIFYAVGPVITVMFPVISSRVKNGLSYILPLFGALVFALGLSMVMISAYFIFPKFIISILYGNKYLTVIPYMGLFSLFITIYTVNSILTHFLLSVSYFRPIYFLFPISLIQGLLIFIIHDTFWNIIWVNIAVSLIYFIILALAIWQKEGKVISTILLTGRKANIYA